MLALTGVGDSLRCVESAVVVVTPCDARPVLWGMSCEDTGGVCRNLVLFQNVDILTSPHE